MHMPFLPYTTPLKNISITILRGCTWFILWKSKQTWQAKGDHCIAYCLGTCYSYTIKHELDLLCSQLLSLPLILNIHSVGSFSSCTLHWGRSKHSYPVGVLYSYLLSKGWRTWNIFSELQEGGRRVRSPVLWHPARRGRGLGVGDGNLTAASDAWHSWRSFL
jgi:hypothetical protein